MSNFRKFISVSAVAVLAATNVLTSLTYAEGAKAWASLNSGDFRQNPLEFLMPDSNVYLYAVTEPNNYYVEFHGNTGTGTMEKQTFTYDDPQALNENAFTKTGYTYSGWNTEANNTGTGYANKQTVENLATTGTVDMYAQWNVNSYNITYDLNDTEGSSSGVLTPTPAATVNYDSGFTVANPSRTGYTFSGWDISNMDSEKHTVGGATSYEESATGVKGTAFENLRATSGTVEFLAKWIADLTPYTVKHCKEVLTPAGTYETDCSVENLSGYTDQNVTPAVTGYDGFTAPSTQTKPVTADGNTEFTYNYNRNSYTLTLIAGTGVQTAKGTGTVNAAGVTTTENNTNTGSFRFEEPIEFSYVLKSGYQNATWSGYGDTASSFTMPVGGAVKEIFAETITYTVTGNYHGGTGASPDVNSYVHTYTVETSLTLPSSLTREHSIFSGWTGEGITTPTKNVTVGPNEIGDKVYHAVWDCVAGYHLGTDQCVADEETEYEVKHYQEELDGSYTLKETETPHGTTDTRAVWTGKTYEGFSGGYLSGAEQTINGDVTNNKTIVYVRYDRDSYNYTITAPAGGVEATAITSSGITAAHLNEDGKITYGDEVTLSATMTGGYEFDYWEVKDGDNNPVIVTDSGSINAAKFDMPASAVTITPHLKMTSYDIHYDYNEGALPDGTANNPVTYNVETDTFTLNIPERDNSTFVGWSGGVDGETPTTQASVTIAKGSVGDRTYEAIWSCYVGYHADGDSCVANTYTITVDYDDDDKTNTGYTVTYDNIQEIPNPTKSGYIFSGWSITGISGSAAQVDSGALAGPTAEGIKGTHFYNLTDSGTVAFTAEWIADEVTYTVHHYTRVLSGDTYEVRDTAVTYTGKSGDPVNFNAVTGTYEGFTYTGGHAYTGTIEHPETASGPRDSSTTIERHGNTHIYLYYDRNKRHVTTSHDTGVVATFGDGDYEYGADVTVSAQLKTGYHFVQWTGTPTPAPTSTSVTP